MVAPRGTVKDAIALSTPNLFTTVFKVTGIVALDEAVLKANTTAVRIFLKKLIGETFQKKKKKNV